jgi:hypothetical protein
MDAQLLAHQHYLEKGIERFSPFWTPAIIPNMGAGYVSMEFGTRGPLASSSTACAASSMAIGDAMMYIRAGMADAMLAGGSECGVVPVGLGGFHGIRALSTRNDDPTGASRPFDATRDGIVLAEGATVLVLEELEHALRRDAEILAEVSGYGLSSDARHVTEPDPTGENPARAITNALADAGRLAEPAVLLAALDRMLADPRAEALVDTFVLPWLHLAPLADWTVDEARFPEFTPELRRSMLGEARRLVLAHLREVEEPFVRNGVPEVEGEARGKGPPVVLVAGLDRGIEPHGHLGQPVLVQAIDDRLLVGEELVDGGDADPALGGHGVVDEEQRAGRHGLGQDEHRG